MTHESGPFVSLESPFPLYDPTSQEDVSSFAARRLVYDSVRNGNTPYETEAILPSILGFVPVEEQQFFTEFVPFGGYSGNSYRAITPGRPDYRVFNEGMPITSGLIFADAERWGSPITKLLLAEQVADAGLSPMPNAQHLHIDPIGWAIGSTEGTLAYSGPARFLPMLHGGLRLDESAIDRQRKLDQVPPFAIVRLEPFTIHAAPVFSTYTKRKFAAYETKGWN